MILGFQNNLIFVKVKTNRAQKQKQTKVYLQGSILISNETPV